MVNVWSVEVAAVVAVVVVAAGAVEVAGQWSVPIRFTDLLQYGGGGISDGGGGGIGSDEGGCSGGGGKARKPLGLERSSCTRRCNNSHYFSKWVS